MSRLVAHEVAFEYPGGIRAVERVSVALEPGELVSVLGPNGAGKSTLLRLLAGLLAPLDGSVALDGEPLAGLDARARARRVAVVPQWLARIPDVRVEDFVLGGRYGHLDRWRRARAADLAAVARALEAADVADLADRTLPTLSGGQRRRVLVARALAQEAGLLLVDEPTSELDPEHQLAVFALLSDLAARGHGILVVTHDLNLASQHATRLVLMRAGRTLVQGNADAVLAPDVLREAYRAPFRTGRWPTAREGGERPYAVPWNGPG